MTYNELLKWGNKFIIKSGIREFCQNTCKGSCCSNYRIRTGCNSYIKCNKKLSCVLYICYPIQEYMKSFNINLVYNYSSFLDNINSDIRGFLISKQSIDYNMYLSSAYTFEDVKELNLNCDRNFERINDILKNFPYKKFRDGLCGFSSRYEIDDFNYGIKREIYEKI